MTDVKAETLADLFRFLERWNAQLTYKTGDGSVPFVDIDINDEKGKMVITSEQAGHVNQLIRFLFERVRDSTTSPDLIAKCEDVLARVGEDEEED